MSKFFRKVFIYTFIVGLICVLSFKFYQFTITKNIILNEIEQRKWTDKIEEKKYKYSLKFDQFSLNITYKDEDKIIYETKSLASVTLWDMLSFKSSKDFKHDIISTPYTDGNFVSDKNKTKYLIE